MSKSIYDEALQEIRKVWNGNPLTYPKKTIKALERAKKQEKLYKRLFNVCKEYKHTSIGLSDDSEFLNVMFELEEELK